MARARYEDFVTSPRETTSRILEFIGLEWDPVFEQGFARLTFDPGRTEAFRRDLGINDVALNDSLASRLARYGYAEAVGLVQADASRPDVVGTETKA